MTNNDSRQHDRATRIGGGLISVGAFLIVVAIAVFVGGGAVPPAGATSEMMADTIVEKESAVLFSGAISIGADLFVAWGAFILARRPQSASRPAYVAPAWLGVALAMLLTLQFNLLTPRAIIPMAHGFDTAPLLFETVYRSFNLIHSVGLLLTYVCMAFIFFAEARSTKPVLPRAWMTLAAVAWALGIPLGIGLIAENPLFVLAPVVLFGWLTLTVYGARVAFSRHGGDARVDAGSHVAESA